MTKTVLSIGASCAQADLHGITAFQYLVQSNASELTRLLLETDKLGVKDSINHVVNRDWFQIPTWPLAIAAKKGNLTMVLQLLSAGAALQLDFKMWLKDEKHSSYVPPPGLLRNHLLFMESSG